MKGNILPAGRNILPPAQRPGMNYFSRLTWKYLDEAFAC